MSDPLCFFTVDHGTASTCAALLGRVDGRFRLLAASSIPSAVPVEGLLGSLVRDAAAADATLFPTTDDWRAWTRLEVRTLPPPRAVVAAPDERRLAPVEAAVAAAGWAIAARLTPQRTGALAATEACLDPDVGAVFVGASDDPNKGERAALGDVTALIAAVATRRDDLWVVLAGAAAGGLHDAFPAERLVLAPAAPRDGPADTALLDEARTLARRVAVATSGRAVGPSADPFPDGRATFARSIATVAAILDRVVEGVDLGYAASTRVSAVPDVGVTHVVSADAALAPPDLLSDDALVDAIARWSTGRGSDLADGRDRARDLRLAPWRGASGEGARFRLTAARAALERLDRAWTVGVGRAAAARTGDRRPDLAVLSGGAFGVAPPAAAMLAAVDTLRRPGAVEMAHDHARVLAPLGALESEADRRRLLVDLLEDVLLPLGTAVVAAGPGPRLGAGRLRIIDGESAVEVPVASGTVQSVPLPAGRRATLELETRDGSWLGTRSRRVALDVAGGVGGVLVDTRDVPLRLPERNDQRRELLDAWHRIVWPEDEA